MCDLKVVRNVGGYQRVPQLHHHPRPLLHPDLAEAAQALLAGGGGGRLLLLRHADPPVLQGVAGEPHLHLGGGQTGPLQVRGPHVTEELALLCRKDTAQGRVAGHFLTFAVSQSRSRSELV